MHSYDACTQMLKGAKTSLWIRQIQLGIGGLAIGTFGAYANDGAKIVENGFFQVCLVWSCINAYSVLVVPTQTNVPPWLFVLRT